MQMRQMEGEERSDGAMLAEEMLRASEWATSMLNSRRVLRTIPLVPLEDDGASVVAEQEQQSERKMFSGSSDAEAGSMEPYTAALFKHDLIDGTLLEDCDFDENGVLDVVIGETGQMSLLGREDMPELDLVSTSTSDELISYNEVRPINVPRRSRRRGSRRYGSSVGMAEARGSGRSGEIRGARALPTTAPLAEPYDRLFLPSSTEKRRRDTVFLILLGLLVLGIVGVISFGYLLTTL